MITWGTLTSIVVVLFAATTLQGSATTAAPPNPDTTHHGVVAATVIDGSGKPVAEAKVMLTDTTTKETLSQTTDRHGKCKFTQLFPGAYSIQAKNGEMESVSQDLDVRNKHTATARMVLRPKK